MTKIKNVVFIKLDVLLNNNNNNYNRTDWLEESYFLSAPFRDCPFKYLYKIRLNKISRIRYIDIIKKIQFTSNLFYSQ
ncbi:hypothetical protein BpHYR1_016870 [Brachionus plicatilis]|uniref:Uncharacterized protein n=1 Tax=Brachionus plicatilis TaxID=10195 RepID=A0A3M7QTC0_BRAPC|nr:hypothetical protein BpHYR1_016870 [Brachionus plicatilis]